MNLEKKHRIVQAVKSGDLAAVQAMVAAEPALVKARSQEGVSALLWSIYYGRQDVTAFLLGQPGLALDIFEAAAAGRLAVLEARLAADPTAANAFAPDGFQPLGLAAFFGHEKVARVLLAAGADPNMPSRNDQAVPPLNSAAAGGHLALARLLLDHGADPNGRQAGGFTPLHSAMQNGQKTLVALLLERGADSEARADNGLKAGEMREK